MAAAVIACKAAISVTARTITMATKEQKQELVETLKFTPVTYTVTISGHGGEIVMGKVDRKIVDYFEENNIDLEEFASSWGEPGDDDYIEVPEDLQPFSQGNWYDCDNIEHNSGAEFGGSWITVSDENGNEVWTDELSHQLEDIGCEIECFCSEDIGDYLDKDTAVFVGQNFEKGCFFDAELYLTQPFDPSKFKFTYSEIADWSILNVVEYAGEELDGADGYSTTGKSTSFEFYKSNDVPVLEGEEEWAQKSIDISNETVSSFSTLVQALSDSKSKE